MQRNISIYFSNVDYFPSVLYNVFGNYEGFFKYYPYFFLYIQYTFKANFKSDVRNYCYPEFKVHH